VQSPTVASDANHTEPLAHRPPRAGESSWVRTGPQLRCPCATSPARGSTSMQTADCSVFNFGARWARTQAMSLVPRFHACFCATNRCRLTLRKPTMSFCLTETVEQPLASRTFHLPSCGRQTQLTCESIVFRSSAHSLSHALIILLNLIHLPSCLLIEQRFTWRRQRKKKSPITQQKSHISTSKRSLSFHVVPFRPLLHSGSVSDSSAWSAVTERAHQPPTPPSPTSSCSVH
jgi:hypothetical protein